jgi:hypothetical protein
MRGRSPPIALLGLLTALAGPVAGLGVAPAAAQEKLAVSREACNQLADYVPDPGIAYKPGVDVNGQAVAPADLPGNAQIAIPEEFSILVTADLGQKLGIPANSKNYQSYAYIGTVTYKDGQVYFNDQPLQDPQAAALAQACRQAMQGR